MNNLLDQLHAALLTRNGAEIISIAEQIDRGYQDGKIIELPCSVGQTVYRLCKCDDIPEQLDGTMYSADGSPGTATGYYCPYEGDCPFDTDDCNKVKNEIGIFEDAVKAIRLYDGECWIDFENVPCAEISDFGKTVFLTLEAAKNVLKEREKNG